MKGMKWFQGTYTARFNTRHRLKGHLFQGRYKAIPVEGEKPEYFRCISEYIHLNPARAGLVDKEKADVGHRMNGAARRDFQDHGGCRTGW